MYQNVTEGKFISFDIKLSNLEFHYLGSCPCPSITDIVEAMNTLIQERHNHRENVSQLKCLEEVKKLRITMQMKNQFLSSLVRTRGTIPEVMLVMLVMNLEWCWEEKYLKIQNLLGTLCASVLSCFTRNWLNTMS